MLGAESAQRLRRLRRVVGLRRFRGAWPELEALGIVLLALQPLEQPTAIERLIPLYELVRTFAGDRRRGDE
jgi:hypothetical protein